MAAEAGSRHQRLLQVDGIAHLGRGEAGAGQGLQGDVGGVALVPQAHHRQADAVGGDGVAEFYVAEVQAGGVHCEGHVLPLAAQGGQGTHRFDNAGKHADHLDDDGAQPAPAKC
ncbi:hypothetical protein D3C72_2021970 [compost metagenome]